MTGLDAFLDLFGNITVLNLVQFILAIVFIVIIFKKVKDYLDDKKERMIQEYEKNKERDRKLQIALEAIDQYPKYRQQSLEIQQHLEGEIQELRKSQQENTRRLVEMEAGHGWKPKHSGSCSKIMRKMAEMATFILWCSRQ